MDDSRNSDDIDETNEFFFGFRHKHGLMGSQNFLTNLMNHSLVLASENLLMDRKSGPLALSDFEPQNDNEAETISKNSKTKGKYASKHNNKVSQKRHKAYAIQSSYHDQFPLNFIAFLAVLALKLAGYQISLFLKLFTFPIWFYNFFLMFFLFPFQTLTWIRENIICKKFKSEKSVLKLPVRLGGAIFCAGYVFSMLFGLLVTGFTIGSVIMRNLAEESIHKTETLNFDYTKTSPVAVVPITPFPAENSGRRSIPYNQKLQLTVSLTLPESEYSRKLGIFQVRVESVSANGKVMLDSSHPTMLRFKSKPIRTVETLFNSVPLITGLKSEVQNLKIVMREFKEGLEPTAFFKVILEQRAEFEGRPGVPEIYAALLEIASELSQLKKVL